MPSRPSQPTTAFCQGIKPLSSGIAAWQGVRMVADTQMCCFCQLRSRMLSGTFSDCGSPVQLSVCLSSMSSTMPRIINFLASLTHLAKQVKLGCSCPLINLARKILSKLSIVPGRTPSSKASFFLPVPGDLAGDSQCQKLCTTILQVRNPRAGLPSAARLLDSD